MRESLVANGAALHHHAPVLSHLLLTSDHPLAHGWMHGHARSCLRDVALANPGGNILAIQKHAIAANGRLQDNARALRELAQGGSVVKGDVPLNGFQSKRPVHGAAFQIHISELARQPGGDRTFSGSGGTIDGNDEFSSRRSVHEKGSKVSLKASQSTRIARSFEILALVPLFTGHAERDSSCARNDKFFG